MRRQATRALSPLDKKRVQRGDAQLKAEFRNMAKKNRKKATELINHDQLGFYSLFALMGEIDELNLYSQLNYRNTVALQICSQVLEDESLAQKVSNVATKNNAANHKALKWIVETGVNDDGVYNKYDEVIDLCISLLIVNYEDYTIMPVVADLIFIRNRKELYVHDLVWAYSQCSDPRALYIIVDYLKSNQKCDVELACHMLHLAPEQYMENSGNCSKYDQWLNANMPYLYFTGEGMQMTSEPTAYLVNQEARYLHLPVDFATGEAKVELNEQQAKLYQEFQMLSGDERRLLSQYSLSMYNHNKSSWAKWMSYPMGQQLEIAKNSIGGVL